MKKIFAALLCGATIIASFAGCGYQDALTKAQTTTSAATSDETQETTAPSVVATDYDDSFDGLISYFTDLGYFAMSDGKVDDSKVTKMDASLIGATEGNKYSYSLNSNNITIELYSYDLSNLDDTANEIIASVKENGTFTILELPAVTAYLSDNGKYLMIYNDTSISSDNPDTNATNYTQRETVIENFKAFHK